MYWYIQVTYNTYIQYIHTYIHAYIHTYIITYIHTYIITYIHTHIHTYIHTYIHTHIHTYIHTYRGHKGTIWSLAIYGDRLFSSSSDGTVKVWDVADLRRGCLKTVVAHKEAVCIYKCIHYLSSIYIS